MTYIVIDNIFDNPEFYVQWARTLSYDYTEECRNGDIKKRNLCTDQGWRGYRSNELTELDSDISTTITTTIYQKALYSCITKPFIQTNYMHFLNNDVVCNESSWHPDMSNFAGVVYLNPTPEPDSGTLIKIDNKIIQIDNIFNRLLVYDAKIEHRPQKSFGINLTDARLTITFFVWLAPDTFH